MINFKAIIFKSNYSQATYLWNGTSIICVLAPKDSKWKKDREIGTIMNGFQDVDFEILYKSNIKDFKNGSCTIISKI